MRRFLVNAEDFQFNWLQLREFGKRGQFDFYY